MTDDRKDVSLDHLLSDPITHLVMASDGVTEAAIRQLMFDVSERLNIGRADSSASVADVDGPATKVVLSPGE